MKRYLALALAAALSVLLTGCGATSTDGGGTNRIDRNATLRVDYAGVQTLDPAENTGSTAMISNTWPVYDRLLNVSNDGKYLPMLATKWAFSRDGRSLSLDLRDGVVFSDGTAFDAAAVKANIERYKQKPASQASSSIIKSVQVLGTHRVLLHLTGPSTDVLSAISSAAPGIMVSPKALHSKDLGTRPVGTGAWVVNTFRPGQQVTYRLRPDTDNVWDPQTGRIAHIDIRFMDTGAAYAALQSGQLDVALSDGDVSRLQSRIDSGQFYLRKESDTALIAGLFLRQDLKPFDNILVRQAVNYAIDREALTKAIVPTTSPRVQPMAAVVNGFDPALEKRYPYDPAKAKALLSKAGYSGGVDAGTVYVAQYQPFPQVAQVVQSDLAKVGIRIQLEQRDIRELVTTYSKSRAVGQFNFMPFTSLEPGASLAWFLDNPLLLPGGVPSAVTSQIGRIDDPMVSAEERARRARTVIHFATEKAYYAPLYQGANGWVVSSKVHGIGTDPGYMAAFGGQDFRHAWISD